MICPHCNDKAVFEATDLVEFRPVIENWKMDDPLDQLHKITLTCINCQGKVRVDLRSKTVTAIEDTGAAAVIAKILATAKSQKKANVPNRVIDKLNSLGFHKAQYGMVGLDVVRLILEKS